MSKSSKCQDCGAWIRTGSERCRKCHGREVGSRRTKYTPADFVCPECACPKSAQSILCRACDHAQRQAAAFRGPCRHCGKRLACRPKGLCHPCYYDAAVREQYKSQGKYAYRSEVVDKNGGYQPPKKSTQAAPGSKRKVSILIARAKAGTGLWHPGDAACGPSEADEKELNRAAQAREALAEAA